METPGLMISLADSQRSTRSWVLEWTVWIVPVTMPFSLPLLVVCLDIFRWAEDGCWMPDEVVGGCASLASGGSICYPWLLFCRVFRDCSAARRLHSRRGCIVEDVTSGSLLTNLYERRLAKKDRPILLLTVLVVLVAVIYVGAAFAAIPTVFARQRGPVPRHFGCCCGQSFVQLTCCAWPSPRRPSRSSRKQKTRFRELVTGGTTDAGVSSICWFYNSR